MDSPNHVPDTPEVRKAIRSLKRTGVADWVQIVSPAVVVVLVALGMILALHTLNHVVQGQRETHETLTTLKSALAAAPTQQDAAIRQLLGCPASPAPCPNLRDLIVSLGAAETAQLDSLLSRPTQTRVVTLQGRTRTIVITRTVTRTVVVCRRPNGRSC